MSRPKLHLTSRRRRWCAVVLCGILGLTGLVAGFLAGVPAKVPPALAAACKSSNGPCVPGFRTAAVDVTHGVPGASVTPVEPDTGEKWTITGYWNTDTVPICYQLTYTATASVAWTGSGWELSDVATTFGVMDVDICDESTCDKVDLHGYGYRLSAKLRDPDGGFYLRQVVFEASDVDDGQELDTSMCSLGTAVRPTEVSFTATDSGPFGCGYSCDEIGASLLISYE
jgi:hypothetical protein